MLAVFVFDDVLLTEGVEGIEDAYELASMFLDEEDYLGAVLHPVGDDALLTLEWYKEHM